MTIWLQPHGAPGPTEAFDTEEEAEAWAAGLARTGVESVIFRGGDDE